MTRKQPKATHPESLILPPRQLRAALRKSADRAQRLADAFGQSVPTVASTPRKTVANVPKKR